MPQKKVVSSAGNVMDLVLADAKGIMFINYLRRGHIIDGEYDANLPRQLLKAVKEKCQGNLTEEVLFHRDNVPPHKYFVSVPATNDLLITIPILVIWSQLVIICSPT